VDEIKVFRGHKYLTLVYQLNTGVRRLLWCGPERRAKTLLRFFHEFGKERSARIKFVCSDMWAPYLKVIARKAPQSLNVLDRFHIMRAFNEAIDQIRREEVTRFKANRQENVLERGRWRPLAAAETPGEPLREADGPAGRAAQAQPGVDQGLPATRELPAVLGLSASGLRWQVSRQLGDPGSANRLGTDEESGADATQSQAAGSQLVQGQGPAI